MVLEGLVVAAGHHLARVHLILPQGLQLGQQHGGLDCIQTGVHAHADIVVLAAGALAVDADGTAQIRDGVIIGKDGAAVTVAAQGLGREEGRGGDIAEGAALAALVGTAEALGGILDEGQAVLLADGHDGVKVAGIAQDIHRHHGLGLQRPVGQHGLDLLFQALGAQGIGVPGDVAEDAGGAEHLGRLRGGDKGHVRAEHGVALPYPGDHVGDLQGVGTVGAGDAVLAAHEFGQLLLQLLHLRSADELGGIQHLLDIGVDLCFHGAVLRLQINELHALFSPFVLKSAARSASVSVW